MGGKNSKQEEILSDDPDGEMKEIFNMFDQNKDGSIDWRELRQLLAKLDLEEVTEEEAVHMIALVDKNFDRKIQFEEFKELYTGIDPKTIEIREAWGQFSAGKDFLEVEQIIEVMKTQGHEIDIDQAKKIIRNADYDKDGKLGYTDFCNMMQNYKEKDSAPETPREVE